MQPPRELSVISVEDPHGKVAETSLDRVQGIVKTVELPAKQFGR